MFCWSRQTKKQLQDVEAIQNEIVGQAHLENYALKLFLYADNEDRAARFGKYVTFLAYRAHDAAWTTLCLRKMSQVWLAIVLTHIHQFLTLFGTCDQQRFKNRLLV